MTVLAKILEHESRDQEISRDDFGGGGFKKLVASGRFFQVITEHPVRGREMVFETTYAAEAAAVYDVCDGKYRAWNNAFLPRGLGGMEQREQRDKRNFRVYSVGNTIPDCLVGFGDWIGSPFDISNLIAHEKDDGDYNWTASFVLENGSSIKAAGVIVPGGYILTWWK